MLSLRSEIQLAARLLAKSPRFTAVVVLTLAIGIASNTVIFSALRSVFLRPLPYPDSSRLVYVSQAYPGFPQGGGQFSNPIYHDIVQHNSTLDTLAAYQISGPLALTGRGEPVRVPITYCTPSYFTLLGVHAALGRVFRDNEERLEGAEAVVVLSNGFWQRQFASNPEIVGQTIYLNGRPFTVAGVLSKDFRDSLYEQGYGEQSDAWIPLGPAYTMTGHSSPSDRIGSNLWGIGHLKAGVTIADARADLAALAQRFEQAYPDTFRGYGLVPRPLKDQLLGEFYAPAWILGVASLFLLLIGCGNVGNLVLARLLTRQRELAVRAAVGASSGRLAAQLLVENMLLLLLAGTIGLALSTEGMEAVGYWAASHLPGVIRLQADSSSFLISICISVLTGLLFGVAPAIVGSHVDLRDVSNQTSRQAQSHARRKSQKILVTAEVALALVLLAAAGLLTESFRKLSVTDMGFKTANLLTLRLDLRSAR